MNAAHAHELLAMVGARGYGRVSSLQIATARPRRVEVFTPKANNNPTRQPTRLGHKARAALELLKVTGAEMATATIADALNQVRDDTLKTLQRLRDYGLVTSRTEFMRVRCEKSKGGWRTSPIAFWSIKQG